MVLSCALRDFLSPLGKEIRLGLCKRIFYFRFFFFLICFFHVLCPEWPFWKSNLDFFSFFFFFWPAFFSAICCNTDVCPMDFSSGGFCKGPFFSDWKRRTSWFPVTSTLWPWSAEIPLYNKDPSLNTGCFQWHSMDNKKQLWLQSVDPTSVWILIYPLSKV